MEPIEFFSINQTFYNMSLNGTNVTMAALAPKLTLNSIITVAVYCVLFVVAAAGNLSVIVALFRSKRHRRSRVSLMICHLAVADLVVAFFMIPLEVGWRLTIQWRAGNLACKAFLFLRAFGLYLSSNVLVCVSLDRYFAVLHPLRVSVARKRGKVMLGAAWGVALIYSVPQSFIFHVSPHPVIPGFHQCVTFGFFSTQAHETIYNLMCVLAMYFLPLFVICVAYTCILCEISSRSRENKDGSGTEVNGCPRLRRSDMTHIERARSRTLKMTVTIVAVFVWCWTPYVVMTLWYMFDRESARALDLSIQDGLFIMAVSNSCMNPLVYGSYAMRCKRPWAKNRAGGASVPTPALQRRSTEAGSPGMGTLVGNGTLKKREAPGAQAPIMGRTIHKVGSAVTRTSAVMRPMNGTGRTTGTLRNGTPMDQRSPPPVHPPSMGGMESAERFIIPKPSFHSDPSPHSASITDNGTIVVRSLDRDTWK